MRLTVVPKSLKGWNRAFDAVTGSQGRQSLLRQGLSRLSRALEWCAERLLAL